MPTYEYECSKCRKTFDFFQSMKDDAVKTCPPAQCRMKSWGKGPVKRLLGTGAGLIFKGSGFYITDYRSEGYKAAAKKETSASSGESAPKPDAKPAAKAADKPAADKPAKSKSKSDG